MEAGLQALAKLMKIESILCPTDLSPDSDEALRYAVALSRAYEAELILLHCDAGQVSTDVNAHDAAAQTIKQALVRYSGDSDLSGLEWKSVVITSDDVGEAITRHAAILRVDLIVMRSRRRPHRAALLGSTAESVSRTAPCPVLVMHSDERDWVTGSETKIDLNAEYDGKLGKVRWQDVAGTH
jgi:universal stress protein A